MCFGIIFLLPFPPHRFGERLSTLLSEETNPQGGEESFTRSNFAWLTRKSPRNAPRDLEGPER